MKTIFKIIICLLFHKNKHMVMIDSSSYICNKCKLEYPVSDKIKKKFNIPIN